MTERLLVLLLALVSIGVTRADGRWTERVLEQVELEDGETAQRVAQAASDRVEQVVGVRGWFGPADAPEPWLEPDPQWVFETRRVRMKELTVDRVACRSPLAALTYAYLVSKPDPKFVVDVRGRFVVVVWGSAAEPGVAERALRAAWEGVPEGNAGRSLMGYGNAHGYMAWTGVRFGPLADEVVRDLDTLRERFGDVAAHTPTSFAIGELTWLAQDSSEVRLRAAGKGFALGATPSQVWRSESPAPIRGEKAWENLLKLREGVPAPPAAPASLEPAKPVGSSCPPAAPKDARRPLGAPSSGLGQTVEEIGGSLGDE